MFAQHKSSSKRRRGTTATPHGNYQRYYVDRHHGAGGEDTRLALLKDEWFRGKK
jgi:hypothetical protein